MNALTTWTTTIDSPVGPLLLTSDGTALTRLLFAAQPDPSWSTEPCPVLDDAARQLGEYFAGERRDFDLPLDPVGTPFQLTVWAALREIPYAETINYGQLAGRVGNPNASRAVGLANGRNPISIVVPCHRVIGANGSLTGYGGGLDRKRTLLELERRTAGDQEPQLSLL
ncbi:MAG TPA: methylated-DNA--[protein]-cysteine S-methyltransferase [Actinomycetes bacterium]|nr:methylated-DNA--[protein]-cysteine S-methyltransferase [Actinomycetes bacterium]